ncbi:MAG: hypothetical protein AAB549_00470 [Patescibacteria group bacterium]
MGENQEMNMEEVMENEAKTKIVEALGDLYDLIPHKPEPDHARIERDHMTNIIPDIDGLKGLSHEVIEGLMAWIVDEQPNLQSREAFAEAAYAKVKELKG